MLFQSLHPMAALTGYHRADVDGRSPSQQIWKHLDGQSMNADGTYGWIGWADDFEGYNTLASTGAFGKGPYYGFIENSGTITSLTTDLGGVIQLTTGGTADNDTSMGMGQIAGLVEIGVGVPGTLTSNGGKVLFEARVRAPSVTDGDFSWAVGLIEPGCVANDGFITDAHALGAKDFVGFSVTDDDGDELNFGYSVGSGSPVSVGTSALTAATFYKVGFVYNPDWPTASRIRWYVNGAEQSTYVTGTTVSASTFPGGEPMHLYIQVKADDTDTPKIDLDWWAVAMQGRG